MGSIMDTEVKDKIKKVILESEDIRSISCNVSVGEEIDKQERKKISTIFRRRFKPEDIVAVSYEDSYEAGFCMTNEGMFCFGEGDTVLDTIPYFNVTNVDYDDETVIITVDGDEKLISPCEDCEIDNIRAFYNLFCDILEAIGCSRNATAGFCLEKGVCK